MEINFIPVDYDYFDWQGRNYAKIIGRTDKGKQVCVIDSFEPYFWAILKPNVKDKKIKQIQDKIERIKIENSSRVSKVLKTEIHNKNFLGNEVKAIKIFITNFKDAHSVADKIGFKEIDKRREYDLGFVTKYILERKFKPLHWHKVEGELVGEEFGGVNNIDVDMCLKAEKIGELSEQQEFNPRILAYDIEADELEIGKGEILMISLVGKNLKKVFTWKHCSKDIDYVECFKDEADMLEGFVKAVKKYSPDILAGYFSDGFDLPYLRARAEKNKMKLNLGIDDSQPVFSRGRILTGKIKGIVHIDLLRFIRNAYSQYMQSETLSLNEVSSELLGEKKLDFSPLENVKSKNTDWENFFKYNLQDSVLAYKLTEKLWPDLQEFTRIVQEPLFNIARNTMASNVEDYVIHNLERFNEIAEKRPTHDEIGKRRTREKYEGAFVFQPTPGIYDDICFFDFTSFWPSIIVSFNLSRSTFLDKKEKGALEVDIGKKVYFNKKPGFFPGVLGEVIEKRKKYKKEYSKNSNPITKARSNAYKLLANAAYGYQGFFGARYYCPEASAATTAISRDFIKKTIEQINKEGYEVTYSDTDSIAFKLNKHTKKQTLELLKKINSKLPGIMELDLEDFYKRGIWVTKRTGDFGAKKKYALIDEKGNLKIRGFETVRRDWCTLARETQNKVLQMVLENGNEKKALDYLKQVIKKIKSREVSLKELMIRTQLKKPLSEYKSVSPHVKIARKMQEKEMPVNIGMLIEYYIGESANGKKALVRERAKMPDEKGEYDIGYYLKNQILPAVENIFEAFGVDVNELIEGKEQRKLGDF